MQKIFLFLALAFSANINAQLITLEQAEMYGNELVKKNFLTPRGKTILLQELKKENIEVDHPSTVKAVTYSSKTLSKESILQFCLMAITTELMNRMDKKGMAIEEKINPKEALADSSARTYSMMDGLGTREEYAGSITTQTSVFGFTRSKTLNTFLESGLIDQKIFDECKVDLHSKKLRDEVALLHFMLSRSTYYRFYEFNKSEQEVYIQKLLDHGILDEKGKESLLKSYRPYELKTIPEILKQSQRYRLVNLYSYPPDPKITYPVIFDAVKSLLPAFHYEGLTVTLKEEKDHSLIREDLTLGFSVDTLQYSHSFFHTYRKPIPEPNEPVLEPSRVDQDFHKGINKWLTDMESPYRLFTINIMDEDERAYGQRSVGLLLLKQGEDSLITSNPYNISRESFDNRLSKKNIRKLLADFTQHGLFSHLSKQELDSAEEKIATSEINSIEDILLHFPKTIVFFDWETGNLENPYEDLTRQFMDASRGAFRVSNITDEFKKGWDKAKQVKYGFTMNGKRYEKMMKFDGDWLDPEFLQLIKTALSEQKVNGNIYYCVDDGQVGGYIFLSPGQYKFLHEFYPGLIKEE